MSTLIYTHWHALIITNIFLSVYISTKYIDNLLCFQVIQRTTQIRNRGAHHIWPRVGRKHDVSSNRIFLSNLINKTQNNNRRPPHQITFRAEFALIPTKTAQSRWNRHFWFWHQSRIAHFTAAEVRWDLPKGFLLLDHRHLTVWDRSRGGALINHLMIIYLTAIWVAWCLLPRCTLKTWSYSLNQSIITY